MNEENNIKNNLHIAAVVVAAGRGIRMGLDYNKLMLCVNDRHILSYTMENMFHVRAISEIVLVYKKDDLEEITKQLLPRLKNIIGDNIYNSKTLKLVEGSDSREKSTLLGLEQVSSDIDTVITHDGARPFATPQIIDRLIEAYKHSDLKGYITAVPVKDTMKISKNNIEHVDFTPDRNYIYHAQTPQIFDLKYFLELYRKAISEKLVFTDDSMLLEIDEKDVGIVTGSYLNQKITTPEDKLFFGEFKNMIQNKTLRPRVGSGYDVHDLQENRKLILGGVEIPHDKGLMGHSDADVLIHSIMDAILGALSLSDIGDHFPDTDNKYKDIDSRILLRKVFDLMIERGFEIGNVDCTVCCQRPKLRNFIDSMRQNIAEDLKIDITDVSIKATTTEKLGFVGREEGIASYATVMLFPKEIICQ